MTGFFIHDWDDEKSLTILRNCNAVMSPGNKLLLVESVIPPGNDPFMGKFLDLTMMLIPGAQVLSDSEPMVEEYSIFIYPELPPINKITLH